MDAAATAVPATPTPQSATVTGTTVTPPVSDSSVVIDIDPKDGPPFVPAAFMQPLDRAVMSAVYAELVRMDASGTYVPYLASRVPSTENGLVQLVGHGEDEHLEVTFELRPVLFWHDGQPLTAHDLVFSWTYVMTPVWPGNRYGRVGLAPELFVAAVDAPAADRVRYRFMSQREARAAAQTGGRLDDPAVYTALANHAGPVIPFDYPDVGRNVYPKHLLNQVPPDQLARSEFAKQPVYAGAYRMVQAPQPDQPVVLEAFADFALGTPAIAQIVFGAGYRFPQAEPYWQTTDVLATAFAADAVQAQLEFPFARPRAGADPRAYNALARDDRIVVDWVPSNAWETLDFNLDNPHLAELKVRQAIAYAIDRQALIAATLAGHGQLMDSYLPAWHPLYAGDGALPDYGYDPQRARALLEQAGYDVSQTPAVHPERGPLALTLDTLETELWQRQATTDLLEQQLAQIGIDLETTFHPMEAFLGEDCSVIRNGRRFDLGLAGWVGAAQRYPVGWVNQALAIDSIPTPENGCPYLKSNWTGWHNEAAEVLRTKLKDGRLAMEQPEAYRQAWAEHQHLWATDLPSIALFNIERPVTYSRALEGVQPSTFAISGNVEDTWNIHAWTIQR